jgi:GntR family transcriptional regulator
MQVVIDIDESVPDWAARWTPGPRKAPSFAQLVEQIKHAVRRGELRPSDALPSVQQLASDLALDAHAVAKAYRILEAEGVVRRRSYRGVFVSEPWPRGVSA